ncbi:hypothetical protein DPMN_039957 [Dreissena polymorpha]|uniref:Uncharacterized protein n=1 Tax=Dreissena polymorpha TaxID=45954 RepID=A0A9D4CU62_DREPO|nr:hypothetical protein DPMN_039957 [Dreissena polymorpha]
MSYRNTRRGIFYGSLWYHAVKKGEKGGQYGKTWPIREKVGQYEIQPIRNQDKHGLS